MSISEEDIAQLTAMGFPEASARESISAANGNMETAINYLLGDSIPSASAANAPPAEPSSPNESLQAKAVGGVLTCSINQYSVENGRSACTCMALTAASQFLKDQTVTSEFLQHMITQGVANYTRLSKAMNVGTNVEHLSAEEVLQEDNDGGGGSSLFHVQNLGIRQGILCSIPSHPLGLESLLQILREENRSEWMCVLMTKPPETVLLCFPPDTVSPSAYWLIDSHPRPQLGVSSAYAKLHPTLDSLVMSLQAIFPCTDLGPDIPEMMAMMYNSFDLYPLVLKKKEK